MNGPLAGLVDRINAEGGSKGVLIIAGGRPEAFPTSDERGGGPATLAVIRSPQGRGDLCDALGCEPGRPGDARAARGLAMVAFRRALALHGPMPAEQVFGLGATSSPAGEAGEHPGRAHGFHVALQTTRTSLVRSFALPVADRAWQDRVHARAVLDLVATANGRAGPTVPEPDGPGLPAGAIREAGADAATCGHPGIADLLAGRRDRVAFALRGSGGVEPADDGVEDGPLILPGSFRPFHAGHAAMAEVAARLVGRPCGFELSVFHPEKPPLDYVAIASRLRGLARASGRLILSNAPTYAEKARVFPGATFVVGHDTALRILDPKYYGGIAARDAMLAEMEALGTRFLVFGRVDASGRFRETIDHPEFAGFLARRATIVPESGFRLDLSSTSIRARMAEDLD